MNAYTQFEDNYFWERNLSGLALLRHLNSMHFRYFHSLRIAGGVTTAMKMPF